jgi:hypothetical protein
LLFAQSAWEKLGGDLETLAADYEGRSGARRSLQWVIDQFKSGKTDREKLGIDTFVDETWTQEYGTE